MQQKHGPTTQLCIYAARAPPWAHARACQPSNLQALEGELCCHHYPPRPPHTPDTMASVAGLALRAMQPAATRHTTPRGRGSPGSILMSLPPERAHAFRQLNALRLFS